MAHVGRAARPAMTGSPPLDPPVYRPFARLAFASMVLLGTPLGVWMAGGRAPASVIWLHAGTQLFGFFATLIVGVAHHLLPRFTGRAARATALTPCLFAAPAPLRLLRAQLTAATGWLAAAAALEAWLRASGRGVPDAAGMQAVYAMALVGGVLGWVLGVLLRAGPMFVRDWRVPWWIAHATPWALAVSVALTAIASAGSWPLAGAGDALALVTVATVVLAAGALRRAPGALPMLSRSVPEARIFRVSAGSALTGAAVSLIAVWQGADAPYALIDAVRHLLAIGVIGAVVIAMTFRLIPVLEGRPLPWPALRSAALWVLIAAVALRTAQAWLPLAWREASGVLAAIAFACPAANLVLARTRRAAPPD